MSCPELEKIVDFAEDRLAGGESSSIERHLSECRACRESLAWYRGVAATAAADDTAEPPAWVMKKAIALFADARDAARQRGLGGLVARLRAALVFDSLAGGGETVFARSGAAEASRQLLYNASPFDVDLHIASGVDAQSLRVTGQVLDSDSESFESVGGLTVELLRGGDVAFTAITTNFGEFTIESVPPGLYGVRLSGDGREIFLDAAPITTE